jgi:hypothetical protein
MYRISGAKNCQFYQAQLGLLSTNQWSDIKLIWQRQVL